MKKWIKLSTARMSERFGCPECKSTVYCKRIIKKYDGRRENICDYPICPYCGAHVLRSDCKTLEDVT